jgi:plasmid stabilization system protein ParE
VNYFFSEAARAEHLEHVAFYEERRAGLGARYLAAFDLAIDRICAHPEQFPVAHPPAIRRLRLPGFPYTVLYRIDETGIEVLALAHHSRRPGYWSARR